MESTNIHALAFDVFGTTVDWCGTISSKGQVLGNEKGIINIDWVQFAIDWRKGYRPAMDRVTSGERPWATLDLLNRELLDEVLDNSSLGDFSNADKDKLNRVWELLDPWKDSSEGLARLKKSFLVTALSNGSLSMLNSLAKHGDLPWDRVISAELFGCYKPDPRVYKGAAELLGLKPQNMLMVASHKYDLLAAKEEGMQTAFVKRLNEFGGKIEADTSREPFIDIYVDDFLDLADKLEV
jgi:2-haloacid dehalogenase